MRLRLGTRGSRLAMAQAHALEATLRGAGHEVEIVTVRTSGDLGHREVLGAFVKEIQVALLESRADVALHCLKDLPTRPVEGLALSAYLEREDPRDALISRGPTLMELPEGSVVGTGALRRTSQLAAARPDLRFLPLMGNVDTRMRKLMLGEYDAIVLAVAGLKRLGGLGAEFDSLVVHPLETGTMLPAPGQAVLVLETRTGDPAAEAVRFLEHAPTRAAADEERRFLAAFGGGCSVPVAALGSGDGVEGLVASPDGRTVLRGRGRCGETLARELGARGAFEIVRKVAHDRDGGGEH